MSSDHFNSFQNSPHQSPAKWMQHVGATSSNKFIVFICFARYRVRVPVEPAV